MKQRMLFIAAVVVCLSLTAFGTMAYFTAEDAAHNVITSGGIKIELLEWADAEKAESFPQNGVSGVLPGTEVTKIVEVKNTGSSAAYVRVKVHKEIRLAPGIEGDVDTALIVLDFDENFWILGGDGYYYYHEALKPGEVTKPLFASVSFDKTMGDLYQNSTATVDVTAYAVQTANNGHTVMDAQGWPATSEE